MCFKIDIRQLILICFYSDIYNIIYIYSAVNIARHTTSVPGPMYSDLAGIVCLTTVCILKDPVSVM